MKPWDSQIQGAKEGYEILKKHSIVYFAWEERTGKSLTALLIAEEANVIKVLIITKKGKPSDGWLQLLDEFPHNKIYKVTTYHQLHKLEDTDWDLIIIDEAHNYISSIPYKSKIWKQCRILTKDKPIIYLSATPNAQTFGQLYHQLALSNWSPFWAYSTYKKWHLKYGEPYKVYLYKKQVDMFDKVKDARVEAETKHLFVTMSRKELGFEHEPEDVLHYIQLTDSTRALYNYVLKHKVYEVRENVYIEYDTKTKLRFGLHMLEGGTLKRSYPVLNSKGNPMMTSEPVILGNTEKIDYIKEKWGDTDRVAIMYHYQAERIKLEDHFKRAEILQAATNAEGVDLMHIEHLIIYSQDWSTAKHTQRRARQANKMRQTAINVHFLLVKDGVSEEVYDTVFKNKCNYVDSYFMRNKL